MNKTHIVTEVQLQELVRAVAEDMYNMMEGAPLTGRLDAAKTACRSIPITAIDIEDFAELVVDSGGDCENMDKVIDWFIEKFNIYIEEYQEG